MPFEGFDFAQFWEQSNYATEAYVGTAISTQLIETVERELGYKLPQSYLRLLQSQNGGIPRNTCFPTDRAISWADDHVALSGILGIDPGKTYSLAGETGSEFMKQEWGYPDIGHCSMVSSRNHKQHRKMISTSQKPGSNN